MKAIITFLAIAMALSGAHLAAQKAAAVQDAEAALPGRAVSMTGELVSLRDHLFGKPESSKGSNENVVRADTSALKRVSETFALVSSGKIHVLLFDAEAPALTAAKLSHSLKQEDAPSVKVEGRHIEKNGVSVLLVKSIGEDAR